MLDRFPYLARARGISVGRVRLVFVRDSGAMSLADPVDLVMPTGTASVSFTGSTSLLDGATSSSPLPLTPTDEPWSLEVPGDAISDPDGVHDLWVIVEYRTT